MNQIGNQPSSALEISHKVLDVCINVWGKPYQTALAVKSLLAHSDSHIDKIYLIVEKVQPEDLVLRTILDLLSELQGRVVVYEPKFYLGPNQIPDPLLLKKDPDYRLSLRYQYALEQTDKTWLMIIHNDVLFTAGLSEVIKLLRNNPQYFGLGDVGQCWNCPLPPRCDGSMLSENLKSQPITSDELYNLLETKKQLRTYSRRLAINNFKPFPMPECRINEWFMFVNTDIYCEEYKSNSMPALGSYTWNAKGEYTNDIGEDWFRDMVSKGFKFMNIDCEPWLIHGPFHSNNKIPAGHNSYHSGEVYKNEEGLAFEYLSREFARVINELD